MAIAAKDIAPDGHLCRDCKWWYAGECRRFPPTWAHWPNDNQHPVLYTPVACYPNIGPDQWCGEWRAP
jgi:hypothetical protein